MMNRLYDQGKWEDALALLRDTLVIPATLCYICNAPCEKICRKGDVNRSVSIREIKKELVLKTEPGTISKPESNGKRIAVLGSNPAGLAAAYHLRKRGYDVDLFERDLSVLVPYIQAEQLPANLLELELAVIKKMGIKIIHLAEYPALNEYDGVIAVVHNNPNPQWLVPQTKTKQPARLVLEGRKLAAQMDAVLSGEQSDKGQDSMTFNSTYTRFSSSEKKALDEQAIVQSNPSSCLYCDCDKKTTCKLRLYASQYGIKSTRYAKNSTFEALKRQQINNTIRFEQAKCIRCGLCVYNSDNGFTFKNRGFVMEVVLPEENKNNIKEALTALCPTGAIYKNVE
ncbi:NADPH-Fe(3+) oxidoreductase subunit beta [termite gut metagenome]|uniref:NADPH-Fe(3+) oxidoreductase subunit beta n=1 Tax=termite gut metagenome TaxID=433724 RepID=A0A5J4PUN1_9ZZZZ